MGNTAKEDISLPCVTFINREVCAMQATSSTLSLALFSLAKILTLWKEFEDARMSSKNLNSGGKKGSIGKLHNIVKYVKENGQWDQEFRAFQKLYGITVAV